MLNIIARGAMGERIPEGSISMMNLLDEKSLDKIEESAKTRLWRRTGRAPEGSLIFGLVNASVLTVFIIIWLIKLIIDIIIYGYVLYSIYGCRIYRLTAIWNSVIFSSILTNQSR